jgi:hypothetical protein
MRSTTQCIPFAVPSQSSHAKPTTFVEAIKRGWKVVREKTVLGADRRHRHGAVILRMPGSSSKLKVPYTGSIRQGYRFGRPQAA